ncbi:hypothetical protein GGI23_004936 [Coemansia sp. RSA 2559]|nr:hypothetical protein GGI23_004936 [Coemansia sp. RSA 2559]KAJ2868745.1 hypothetical protein GGI22_000669 [Coemansia erecta]
MSDAIEALTQEFHAYRGQAPYPALPERALTGAPSMDLYPSEWEAFDNVERLRFMAAFPGLRDFPYAPPPLVDPTFRVPADLYARDKDTCELMERVSAVLRVGHSWVAQVQPDAEGRIPYDYALTLLEAQTRVLYDALAFGNHQRQQRMATHYGAPTRPATARQAPLVKMESLLTDSETQRALQKRASALAGGGNSNGSGKGNKGKRKPKKKRNQGGKDIPAASPSDAQQLRASSSTQPDAQSRTSGYSSSGGGDQGTRNTSHAQRGNSSSRPNGRSRSQTRQ